jgi:hypothetical protein
MVNLATGTHVPFRFKTLLMRLGFRFDVGDLRSSPVGLTHPNSYDTCGFVHFCSHSTKHLFSISKFFAINAVSAFSLAHSGAVSTESRSILFPHGSPPCFASSRDPWTIQLPTTS